MGGSLARASRLLGLELLVGATSAAIGPFTHPALRTGGAGAVPAWSLRGVMAIDLIVTTSHEEASELAAGILVAAVREGSSIALSGGSTPRRAYELAASLEADWGRATVWLADERCVPSGDPLSNARLVQETILDRVAVPPQFRDVPTDVGAEAAAVRYDRLLREEGLPELVLLGMGPDGHTASLFPGSPALEVRDRLAVATEAGLEPFVARITLTLPAIGTARHVVFLVTGAEKAELARRAFAGDPSPAVPASLARSAAGATTVILDEAAASRLASGVRHRTLRPAGSATSEPG